MSGGQGVASSNLASPTVHTDEPVPEDILETLVDPTWVADMKHKGVNDPRYIARVLGEFPKVSNDSLIQPE